MDSYDVAYNGCQARPYREGDAGERLLGPARALLAVPHVYLLRLARHDTRYREETTGMEELRLVELVG